MDQMIFCAPPFIIPIVTETSSVANGSTAAYVISSHITLPSNVKRETVDFECVQIHLMRLTNDNVSPCM